MDKQKLIEFIIGYIELVDNYISNLDDDASQDFMKSTWYNGLRNGLSKVLQYTQQEGGGLDEQANTK